MKINRKRLHIAASRSGFDLWIGLYGWLGQHRYKSLHIAVNLYRATKAEPALSNTQAA